MSEVAMSVTATVTGVTTKQVVNRRTQQPMTLWLVTTNDGTEWSTPRAEVGNQAMALLNQNADMQVLVKKDGAYENHYLQAIKPNTQIAPSPVVQAAQQAQQAQQTLTQPAQPASPEVTFETYTRNERLKEDRRNMVIFRQTGGTTTASVAHDTPEEFWANVKDLMMFFHTGFSPFDNPVSRDNGVTRHTPADPGPQDSGYQHSDDDVPF